VTYSDSRQVASARPLTLARRDEVLVVSQVLAVDGDATRLKRLGICEGRQLQLVQSGDPLIVRVVGCRVGVSRSLAEQVLVTSCPECETDGASGEEQGKQ